MRPLARGWCLILAVALASCRSGAPATPAAPDGGAPAPATPDPVATRPSWTATHPEGSGLAATGHSPDEVVAVVDGQGLTLQQLVDNALEWWGEKTLEEMIFRSLMDQYAKRAGVTTTQEELAQRADRMLRDLDASIAGSSGGKSSLKAELAQRGETVEGYRPKLIADENFQRQLTVQKLILYDELTAERVEVQDIVVDSPEKAKEVLGKLENHADFARIAADESSDIRSAQEGGRIPPFVWGMGPFGIEVDRAAFALAQGALSQPVRDAKSRYHVIRCLSKTPAKATPYAELKDAIWKQIMTQPPTENDIAHWITRMKELAKDKVEVRWKYGVGGK